MMHDPHVYMYEKRVNELENSNKILIEALQRIMNFGWDAYISNIAKKAIDKATKQ